MGPHLLQLAELNDRNRFTPVRLPVFAPHVRPLDNGGSYTVTEKDLKALADKSNRFIQQTATPGWSTIGHVIQGREVAEIDQPAESIGYVGKYECGTYGDGKPCIWATAWIRNENVHKLQQFQRVSADVDLGAGRILGLAFLKQPPYLDLGVISYQANTGAKKMEPTVEEDEDKKYEGMCQYMKKKFPKLAQYMDDPGPANTDMPGTGDVMPYQAVVDLAIANRRADESELNRSLDRCEVAGIKFDRDVEFANLVKLDQPARSKHLAYMASTYAKKPTTTGFLPVATGIEQPVLTTLPTLDGAECKKMVAYQADGKLTPTEAREKVISERKK